MKLALGLLLLASLAHAEAHVGDEMHAGTVDGLTVDVKVEGPAAQRTPLQIVCLFEYVEGDLTSGDALPSAVNGVVHLDAALHGLVSNLRRSGSFAGHALETMLVAPRGSAATKPGPLSVTFLAGPSFFAATAAALTRAVSGSPRRP